MKEEQFNARFVEREVPLVVYCDQDGARWQVREVDARAVPGARGARCLLFEAEGVVRRVWDYPADWMRLAPAELVSLSWRR
jgi:hypothetical protein